MPVWSRVHLSNGHLILTNTCEGENEGGTVVLNVELIKEFLYQVLLPEKNKRSGDGKTKTLENNDVQCKLESEVGQDSFISIRYYFCLTSAA